jgi:hypothetical protein
MPIFSDVKVIPQALDNLCSVLKGEVGNVK